MSLITFLNNLLLQPLMEIYSQVFSAILIHIATVGSALIVFGVILNLVLLPIYYLMEQSGKNRRNVRAVVDKEVERMKAHYKGRELYYYIKTIHRHYGYRPISVVFTSSALYLQVLVFATVYHFISKHESLNDTAFYSIEDLASPDGLLFGMNLLPFLMTWVNVLSINVYASGRRMRMQGYALAVFFFFLLYFSPSGLVLYWTGNNVFSLVRNIVERRYVNGIPLRLSQRLIQIADQD